LVRTVEFFGIVVFNDRGGACPAAEFTEKRKAIRYLTSRNKGINPSSLHFEHLVSFPPKSKKNVES